MHAAAKLPIASMVKFVKNRRIIEAYQQKREEFRKATAVGCPFYFIGCSAGNVTDPTSWGLRSEARTLRRLIHWTEGVFSEPERTCVRDRSDVETNKADVDMNRSSGVAGSAPSRPLGRAPFLSDHS